MSVTQDPLKPIRITIDLHPDDHRALKIAAAATGMSISDIVRTGLAGFVRRVAEGAPVRPLPPSPPAIPTRSAFELPASLPRT
jgi:hypothetical protein